jgi:hypothetical protein
MAEGRSLRATARALSVHPQAVRRALAAGEVPAPERATFLACLRLGLRVEPRFDAAFEVEGVGLRFRQRLARE